MPERSSKPKRPRDSNQLAAAIVEESTRERVDEPEQAPEPSPEKPEKNPRAQALGRLGGIEGRQDREHTMTTKIQPPRPPWEDETRLAGGCAALVAAGVMQAGGWR